MASSLSPVAVVTVPVTPVPRSIGRIKEPVAKPQAEAKPVEQKPLAETPAYKVAARAPADLLIRPAESGQRLIYVFRDPESGEMIRQYPTEALIALGRLIDRQV